MTNLVKEIRTLLYVLSTVILLVGCAMGNQPVVWVTSEEINKNKSVEVNVTSKVKMPNEHIVFIKKDIEQKLKPIFHFESQEKYKLEVIITEYVEGDFIDVYLLKGDRQMFLSGSVSLVDDKINHPIRKGYFEKIYKRGGVLVTMKNSMIPKVGTEIAEALQHNNDSTLPRPINNFNINILGDASNISINYERLFLISSAFFISSKLGIGYYEKIRLPIFGYSSPEKKLTIPHHITGNIGKGRHFFEFGFGGTFINGNINQNYLIYPMTGYRFQPQKSDKFNFRVFGQNLVSGLESDDIEFIPFGLSIGISF